MQGSQHTTVLNQRAHRYSYGQMQTSTHCNNEEDPSVHAVAMPQLCRCMYNKYALYRRVRSLTEMVQLSLFNDFRRRVI